MLNGRVYTVFFRKMANFSQSLNIHESDNNIYRLLKGECDFNPVQINKFLNVYPSTIDLNAFETEMANEPGREHLLDEVLKPHKNDYDFVLIDCSPSLGLTSLNALTTADSFIIPVLPHHLSIQGLTKLLKITDKIKTRLNSKLELEGILVTQYNQRKIIHRNIYESLKEYFDSKVYNTTIRENIALVEASSQGLNIFEYHY